METISEAWLPVSPVSSPEEKVVERMSMPRASIFASTGNNLTSINIMTKPKVEKKEEKTSITISRPTIASPLLVEVKEEKTFLYAESKRAKAEREKEERRQRRPSCTRSQSAPRRRGRRRRGGREWRRTSLRRTLPWPPCQDMTSTPRRGPSSWTSSDPNRSSGSERSWRCQRSTRTRSTGRSV